MYLTIIDSSINQPTISIEDILITGIKIDKDIRSTSHQTTTPQNYHPMTVVLSENSLTTLRKLCDPEHPKETNSRSIVE